MKISELNKPYIIAEVGSCWDDFDHVKDSIGLAKNCGADAVKFQFFNSPDLYGPQEQPYEPGISPYFHHGWLAGLKEKADAFGIDLMCSAFSVDGIKAVDPYVSLHKVASSENNHVRMLETLNALGKPVLISTGGSTHGDIKQSLKYLRDVEVIPLYCVSDYPARVVNLYELRDLASMFGAVGFSDHSTDSLVIPHRAVELGACVIEKHVNFFDVDCADSPHSLSTAEFKDMCSRLRGKPVSGSGQKDMILKHNRRLVATRTIRAGEKYKEGINFGIYRSLVNDTSALSPFNIELVNGKDCLRDLEAGEGISPAHVRLS